MSNNKNMSKSNPGFSATSKKNLFSNFVFQTNHKLRRGFRSESFVEESVNQGYDETEDISKKHMCTQTNFKSETNISRSPKHVDILKENCTQTSRTIISLIQTEHTGRLSPDSLSPKQETKKGSMIGDGDIVSFEESPLTGNDLDCLPYNRKNDVNEYLDYCGEYQNLDFLTGNSLTKTFLKKSRKKTNPASPNMLFHAPRRSINVTDVSSPSTLRSQSYLESPSQSFRRSLVDDIQADECPKAARFKVKNIIEKKPVGDHTKPVRYFCHQTNKLLDEQTEQTATPTKAPRSMSFMSPTIASEQKDQSIEIKCINKLISPTRRGRSVSPAKNPGRSSEMAHTRAQDVPYIDGSEASIIKPPSCVKINRAVHVKSGAPRRDEDQQLHLDLQLSCEDLTNTTVVGSVTSTTSTECILFQAISRLRDKDWNSALRGLAEVVEICRVLDIDAIFLHMTTINQRLIELIRSPRSHVCRKACQAIGHLFEYVKDTRRPEFDELVDILLCKTADSNKFIRHDANLALDCMVTHLPAFHVVRAICCKGPEHKNPLVRIASARLLVCAVVIAGPQNILHPHNNEYTRKRIILSMVKFLDDKNAEVRKFGERLYKLLYKDRIFDVYLRRYLEKDVILKIKKCLKGPNG